jgi:hypothetical protein
MKKQGLAWHKLLLQSKSLKPGSPLQICVGDLVSTNKHFATGRTSIVGERRRIYVDKKNLRRKVADS